MVVLEDPAVVPATLAVQVTETVPKPVRQAATPPAANMVVAGAA
jgi:hypothetical protein